MFTVSDLLKLTDIRGIRLAAGTNGLDREISRTNVMDNPDMFDWLIAGEFVLSTGYIFRDDERLQRRTISRLAEIGCAGLAIKTNRYLSEMPACMVEQAEKLNFPLLELPYGYSLSTVSEIISQQIYRTRENKLAHAMNVQRQLTMVSLKPGSLRELARIAVDYLEDPILILDSNWRLLAWEDCSQNPYPLDEILVLKRKASVLPPEMIEGMPKTPDALHRPVTRRYPLPDNRQVTCRILPVSALESSIYGYIVVWESVRPMDPSDYMVLEQLGMSVAIERIRAREIEEAKVRNRRDFFEDLLAGNIESLAALRSLAEMHGLKPDNAYRCLLVRYAHDENEDQKTPPHKLETEADLCAEVCLRVARDMGVSVITVPHSLHVVLLMEIPARQRDDESRVRLYAETLQEVLAAQIKHKTLVVVSAVTGDITGIAEAYYDAQSIGRILRGAAVQDSIIFVEDYAVFYLLEKYIDRHDLAGFANKALGALIDYDRENQTSLLQTLDVYFARSGSITEVAKQLYIHRNTCLYRIEKIKTILHDDFVNPMKMLKYQVALLALKITSS